MDKINWFMDKFQLSLSDDEQINIFNRYCDINGIDEHIYPISDHLCDIYKCKEAWKDLIDERGYLDEIFEEYFDLKPRDMSLDEYSKLVEEAYKQFEFESDIEEYLNKYLNCPQDKDL